MAPKKKLNEEDIKLKTKQPVRSLSRDREHPSADPSTAENLNRQSASSKDLTPHRPSLEDSYFHFREQFLGVPNPNRLKHKAASLAPAPKPKRPKLAVRPKPKAKTPGRFMESIREEVEDVNVAMADAEMESPASASALKPRYVKLAPRPIPDAKLSEGRRKEGNSEEQGGDDVALATRDGETKTVTKSGTEREAKPAGKQKATAHKSARGKPKELPKLVRPTVATQDRGMPPPRQFGGHNWGCQGDSYVLPPEARETLLPPTKEQLQRRAKYPANWRMW